LGASTPTSGLFVNLESQTPAQEQVRDWAARNQYSLTAMCPPLGLTSSNPTQNRSGA
jgi:hypothetical protein